VGDTVEVHKVALPLVIVFVKAVREFVEDELGIHGDPGPANQIPIVIKSNRMGKA
jgi:hypothetical protein